MARPKMFTLKVSKILLEANPKLNKEDVKVGDDIKLNENDYTEAFKNLDKFTKGYMGVASTPPEVVEDDKAKEETLEEENNVPTIGTVLDRGVPPTSDNKPTDEEEATENGFIDYVKKIGDCWKAQIIENDDVGTCHVLEAKTKEEIFKKVEALIKKLNS